MRAVQLELEKLPPLGDDKRSWQPNWDVLMTVAEKAVKPAVKVLLTCSTFTVKAALKATRALRPKRKILTKNEDQVKDKEVKEPFSQEDQSINAPAAAADKAMQAEVKRVKKKGGAAVKLVEGLGENAALLPGDEADMNSLASKKLIWTLLEERWFKHSSEEIYRAHHSSHGSWNGQKMRYVNLAYVPYLMLCCLSHLGASERKGEIDNLPYTLMLTVLFVT